VLLVKKTLKCIAFWNFRNLLGSKLRGRVKEIKFVL